MKTRLVALAAGVLSLGGLAALATISGESSVVAAPTVNDYHQCVATKNHAGVATKPVRKLVANGSDGAHAVCGVYLVTGL